MSITSPIIPAITPVSYDDLEEQVQKIIGLPEVHIDVADGIFVQNTLWPYFDGSNVTIASKLLSTFSLEVDLMVSKPLPAAHDWLIAGADQLVFHIETISVEAFQAFTAECSVSVGVSLSSATPLAALYPYLPFADYVQCMGIATIGSQGQPFDDSVITRIHELRAQYPHLPISIDGSVNQNTILKLTNLGISRYIVGSAIVREPDPRAAYTIMTSLVQS